MKPLTGFLKHELVTFIAKFACCAVRIVFNVSNKLGSFKVENVGLSCLFLRGWFSFKVEKVGVFLYLYGPFLCFG